MKSFTLIILLRSAGEKPYKCNICNKSFGYNHVLKLHQVSHFGQKMYKCTLCNETFSSKKAMESHIRKHKGSDLSPADGAAVGAPGEYHRHSGGQARMAAPAALSSPMLPPLVAAAPPHLQQQFRFPPPDRAASSNSADSGFDPGPDPDSDGDARAGGGSPEIVFEGPSPFLQPPAASRLMPAPADERRSSTISCVPIDKLKEQFHSHQEPPPVKKERLQTEAFDLTTSANYHQHRPQRFSDRAASSATSRTGSPPATSHQLSLGEQIRQNLQQQQSSASAVSSVLDRPEFARMLSADLEEEAPRRASPEVLHRMVKDCLARPEEQIKMEVEVADETEEEEAEEVKPQLGDRSPEASLPLRKRKLLQNFE